MPSALFSNDTKLSKAHPTEAEVWKQARRSGLVVDVASEPTKPTPAARCWTTTTRSGPARPTRRRIPPGTRRKPSAKPIWNFIRICEPNFRHAFIRQSPLSRERTRDRASGSSDSAGVIEWEI